MNVAESIASYIASLPEPKRSEVAALHGTILGLAPGAKLWFLDGRDERGKVVSNPNIGYGEFEKTKAGGKTQSFYQVGISANTAGISVYLMSFADKAYLEKTYGSAIGKADVTGYCVRFRSLGNIDLDVLGQAILDAMRRPRV